LKAALCAPLPALFRLNFRRCTMFLPVRSVTHRSAAAFAALVALSLSACSGAPDAEQAADPDAPMAVVDSGLATPESVLWDAERNVWYVSNINGQSDGQGRQRLHRPPRPRWRGARLAAVHQRRRR
jgi:hypothetical protein